MFSSPTAETGSLSPALVRLHQSTRRRCVSTASGLFFDRDASIQPGSLQEVMLHETAVAWMRDRLIKTTPQRAWQESVEEYCTRLKACAMYINDNYNVQGLCRELDRRQGDRRRK